MKNYRSLFVAVFLIVCAFAAYALPIHIAYPTGSAMVSPSYPMPTAADQIVQGVIGSQSVSIISSPAVKVGTLAASVRWITITPLTADVCIGDSGVVTGGASGEKITSGTTKTFRVATTTPLIYMVAVSTTTTVLIQHWY